jgi:phosphoribosylanthranilate isomerase
MPLKTLVKVGNITNLSDARYCAGMGVEMLGFNVVDGTANYINPSSFQEIRGWLSGPLVVAELYSASNKTIAHVPENYRPDLFELSVHELDLVTNLETGLILSVDKNSFDRQLLERWKHRIRFLAVSQADYENNFIDHVKNDFDILVATNDNTIITALTDDRNVKGITLLGGQEIRPGLKDFDALASVLELLETD